MNDLDLRIRAAVDRTVSTAPPPVPVETILARGEPAEEARSRASRRWAMAVPALAAVVLVLLVSLMSPDEPGPGAVVDVEATDAIDPDDAESQVLDAPAEITVREGLWLSEAIPQIAEQLPNVTTSQLWDTLDEHEPRPPFAPATLDLTAVDVPGLSASQLRWEGLLSPGTYSIDGGDNAVDVVERMHDQFVRLTIDLGYRQAPETLGLSPYEVVVLASLVEAAGPSNDADRAKIAMVIHNRLAADLPLGLDSAYPYAAQDRNLEITRSLLETPGPYALRQGHGLPPTPITTPSKASLRAAIDPTPGPRLYYNRGDDRGNYSFATTLAEHNANVAAARENGLLD